MSLSSDFNTMPFIYSGPEGLNQIKNSQHKCKILNGIGGIINLCLGFSNQFLRAAQHDQILRGLF